MSADTRNRKILHLDLDAFFCAVEELRRPELHGKPFAVGGKPNQRGVISSCSYPARKLGVRSAMPSAVAIRKCPSLILLPGDYHAYRAASEQVMEILHRFTGLVEQLSIDEAFLDVSDLHESGLDIAKRLQAVIREETGLPCSIGAASNKLVAKTATDRGKADSRSGDYPCSIRVVPAGEEAAFLAPLKTEALWGVGPKTAERLAEMNLHTIGELAALPEARLVELFGKNGRDLSLRAAGIDERPVETERMVKSISQEVTFDRDRSDGAYLLRTLQDQAEKVAFRLREQGLCASTVRIKLRWPDFSTHSRQTTLDLPTNADSILFGAAEQLLKDIWKPGQAVRLLGIGASNLSECARQLSLWDTPDEKERRLLEALDDLRERYGKKVVRRGRTIRNDDGS